MSKNQLYLISVTLPPQGKKGKRFLDKRRDVLHTFKVVSRSQRDPLVADPSAPQAVLQPTEDDVRPQHILAITRCLIFQTY